MSLTVAEIRVRVTGDLTGLRQDMQAGVTEARRSAGEITQVHKDAAAAQKAATQEALAAERDAANARRQIAEELGRASTVAGAAILGGLAAATKTAADFDQAMRNVNSVAKLGETDFQALRKSVLGVAADPQIRQGPRDLAKALYDIQGAGFETKRGLDILKVSAMGASAGMTDTQTASSALIAILKSNVPGITSTQQAMDLMFRAVDKGKFTFAELAGSIGQVLPDAAAMGVSFQEIAAQAIVATGQGQTFSGAINDLQNLIVKIKNPSKESEAEFQKLGISYGAAALQAKGLSGIIEEVRVKTAGHKDALSALFPDMQANRAITTALSDGGRNYSRALAEMSNQLGVTGSTQAALNEQNKGAGAQWELFKKELESTAVIAGDTFLPMLRDVLGGLRDLLRTFQSLSPAQQEWGVKFAAGVGAALVVVPRIMDAVRAFGLLKTAMGASGAAGASATTAGAGSGLLATAAPPVAALALSRTMGAPMPGTGLLEGAARLFPGLRPLFAPVIKELGGGPKPPSAATNASSADPLGDPADTTSASGFSGIPTRTGAGQTIQPAIEAKKKLTAEERQAAAITKEIAQAQAELNQAQRTGSGVAADIAGKYNLVSGALRNKLVALRENIASVKAHEEAEKKAAEQAAAFARGTEEVRGRAADLRLQVQALASGQDAQTLSLERLRRANQGISEVELQRRAAAEADVAQQEKQRSAWERFNSALTDAKGRVTSLTTGDGLPRLRAEFAGLIPDSALAKLDLENRKLKQLEDSQKAAAKAAEDAKKKAEDEEKARLDALQKLRDQAQAARQAITDLFSRARQETAVAIGQMRQLLGGGGLAAVMAQNPNLNASQAQALLQQQATQRGLSNASSLITSAQAPMRDQLQAALARGAGTTTANQAEDREMMALLRRLERFAGGGRITSPEAQAQRLAQFNQQFSARDRERLAGAVGDPRAFFGQAGLRAIEAGGGQADSALSEFDKAKAALFGTGGKEAGAGSALFPSATENFTALAASGKNLVATLGGEGGGLAAGLSTFSTTLTATATAADTANASLARLVATLIAAAQTAGNGGGGNLSPAQIAQNAARAQKLATERGG